MSRKQLANTLSRIQLDAIAAGRQGRRRRLAPDLVSRLDIVAKLGALGIPVADAFRLAGRIEETASIPVGPGINIQYDREAHLSDLHERLREAAERIVTPRRGRPPAGSARPR